MPTTTARSTSLRRKPLSTKEAASVVYAHMLVHYSEEQLDTMSSTEEARESAAKEIIPASQVGLPTDKAVLVDQLRRFSIHPSCWRSLVRTILLERRTFNATSA